MAEEETVFSSKMSYTGIFSFKDFYKFCYDWVIDEINVGLFSEDKYSEKLAGDVKTIDVEWKGTKDLTDYFRERIQIVFAIKNMSQIKIKQEGVEIDTNKALVEVRVKGIMVKDYKGKFEMTGYKKFMRSVYEKYVIPAVLSELKLRISKDCDEFLGQAKAFLDLEGKRT